MTTTVQKSSSDVMLRMDGKLFVPQEGGGVKYNGKLYAPLVQDPQNLLPPDAIVKKIEDKVYVAVNGPGLPKEEGPLESRLPGGAISVDGKIFWPYEKFAKGECKETDLRLASKKLSVITDKIRRLNIIANVAGSIGLIMMAAAVSILVLGILGCVPVVAAVFLVTSLMFMGFLMSLGINSGTSRAYDLDNRLEYYSSDYNAIRMNHWGLENSRNALKEINEFYRDMERDFSQFDDSELRALIRIIIPNMTFVEDNEKLEKQYKKKADTKELMKIKFLESPNIKQFIFDMVRNRLI